MKQSVIHIICHYEIIKPKITIKYKYYTILYLICSKDVILSKIQNAWPEYTINLYMTYTHLHVKFQFSIFSIYNRDIYIVRVCYNIILSYSRKSMSQRYYKYSGVIVQKLFDWRIINLNWLRYLCLTCKSGFSYWSIAIYQNIR